MSAALIESVDVLAGAKVTVYSLPVCSQCKLTYRALDRAGVAYEVVDLSTDQAAAALVKELGHIQAPVVVAGDRHWSGFRPDMIAALPVMAAF